LRYFIELSYLGTHFAGFQIQPNQRTVQGDLEQALSTILRQSIQIQGSSRTDTGVHARHQMVQAEWDTETNIQDLVHRLNGFLSSDIVIHRIFLVPSTFHARFDASFRRYRYVISKKKNPFSQQTAWYFAADLNHEAMIEATRELLGTHDFQTFSKVKTEVKTFWCTIESASWEFTDDEAIFTIQANRFLRGMVRALVGTLVDVGLGKRKPSEMPQLIAAKNRSSAGATAPALGLSLIEVGYPAFPPVVRSAQGYEMPVVRTFFETYAQELGVDLCFQGFREELISLPHPYDDILWLEAGGQRVGVVALKKIGEGVAEMKRLFILPQFRAKGWSRILIEALENKAKGLGYHELKLDTLERLTAAVALYRSMGYLETKPYNVNPEPDILYFSKKL